MIWEYGGLPFLFKVADQLENFEIVQEIINRVIGIKSGALLLDNVLINHASP